MPVYCYKCKDCKGIFEVRHSMSFEEQVCTICDSKNVFVIPKLSDKIIKSESKRTGAIVDEYIEEAKKEVKKDKKSLLSREL